MARDKECFSLNPNNRQVSQLADNPESKGIWQKDAVNCGKYEIEQVVPKLSRQKCLEICEIVSLGESKQADKVSLDALFLATDFSKMVHEHK